MCRSCIVRLTGLCISAWLLLSSTASPAEPLRIPQYPLKSARTLLSDEEIATARSNIETYESAGKIAQGIVDRATPWLDWDDSALRALIPDADVPRAFNVGTEGCPKCGRAIYEEGGTYPWILDIKKLFKVECPICHTEFPDNDFAAYYASGRQDQAAMQGDYADDGWGWVGPNGERYWLIAYAAHWNQYSTVIPALHTLARAYVLTGDRRYAHKAAVLLDRFAEVYPAYDYHTQSRYGQLQQARGIRYEGKLVNSIWETSVLRNSAEAYDAIWETIDDDTALQQLTGRCGEQTRAHIEANLLEEGIDAYFANKVRGNFGMHQRALATTVLARQQGPSQEWLDGLFTKNTDSRSHIGLNYALYNLVYRDGLPYETAPGYNWSWVRNITHTAEALRKTDLNLYAHPKTKSLYEGPLAMQVLGEFSPSVGDSGNVYGGKVGTDSAVYQAAYRAYPDPQFLRHLADIDGIGETGFLSYESLFHAVPDASPPASVPRPSRLLDGYGMGILQNPANTVGLSLYYGYRGGHAHYDRLHFELFANGHPMMPDLGYPDFMNAYVPGIFTWSKNTIAHNTVTVDAGRQPRNEPAFVHVFADSPFARVIDVEAPGTYPQAKTYRRCLFMIDIDDTRSYFVDFFTVVGGAQHDYSLHGPPGSFRAIGGTWTDPAPGTLAGKDVALAEIYDDPVMGAEGFDGSYGDYKGSGFQHMINTQRLESGDWIAEFTHEKDENAKLRVHVPTQPGQEIILADAQISPVKFKQLVKFVIDRRSGNTNLTSRFVSVLEPYSATGKPLIEDVSYEGDQENQRVTVLRADGVTDQIGFGVTDANEFYTVTTHDAEGAWVRGFLSPEGGVMGLTHGLTVSAIRGEVIDVAPASNRIRVRVSTVDQIDPDALVGRVARFRLGTNSSSHPILDAKLKDSTLTLTTADHLSVGRAHITEVTPQALATNTAFQFAPVYRNRYVTDTQYSRFFQITNAEDGTLDLADPLPENHPFKDGEDVWIVDIGPGDVVRIPGISTAIRTNEEIFQRGGETNR